MKFVNGCCTVLRDDLIAAVQWATLGGVFIYFLFYSQADKIDGAASSLQHCDAGLSLDECWVRVACVTARGDHHDGLPS